MKIVGHLTDLLQGNGASSTKIYQRMGRYDKSSLYSFRQSKPKKTKLETLQKKPDFHIQEHKMLN